MTFAPNSIPNIIIPGAPKAGTSALYNFLTQHPDINEALIKEPHTYSLSQRYEKRPLKKVSNLAIDASTSYFASLKAADRIQKDNPDAKIIFILRDPIDRIVSHYRWILTRDIRCEPFNKEVLKNLDNFSESGFYQWKGNWKNYLDFSLYSKHIEKWGAFQYHIVYQEDLKKNPQHTCNTCFDFLGINRHEIQSKSVNRTHQLDAAQKNKFTKRLSTLVTSKQPAKLLLQKIKTQKLACLQKTAYIDKDNKQWLNSVILPIFQDSLRYQKVGIDSATFKTLGTLKHVLQQP